MMDNTATGLTRRDFAKMATTAAAGFAILSPKKAGAETNSGTLKVGVLGCGNRVTDAAMQMLKGNENVKLVALADLFQDRLDSCRNKVKNNPNPEVSSKYAVEDDLCFVGFDAYKKILATDIDILMEGTLPYSRPKHLVAAVEAGKHIFTEKPAAVDPVGIRMVIEAAKKAKEKGLSFVAGTQRRHQRCYIETIDKIHNGAIGDVVALRAYWMGGLPFAKDREAGWSDFEYCIRNWYAHCWVCGDNIVEQHVHNLDICNWVMGTHPESVVASGGRTWKPKTEKYGDLWDNFSCDYEYPKGIHMSSFSRHWDGTYSEVSEAAVGTKGVSNCQDLGFDGEEWPYIQEHTDLVNSIRGVTPYLNEGIQVAESTLTAIMGRMAAYTGKKITWEEAMNSDLSIVPKEWSFDLKYPAGPIPVPEVKKS
jgi:predicted dehydrogenase